MSIALVNFVLAQPDLDSSEKFLMTVVATYADDYGRCHPKIETIREHCSLSESGITKIIKRCEEKHVLQIVTRKHGKVGETTWQLFPGLTLPLSKKWMAPKPVGTSEDPEPSTEATPDLTPTTYGHMSPPRKDTKPHRVGVRDNDPHHVGINDPTTYGHETPPRTDSYKDESSKNRQSNLSTTIDEDVNTELVTKRPCTSGQKGVENSNQLPEVVQLSPNLSATARPMLEKILDTLELRDEWLSGFISVEKRLEVEKIVRGHLQLKHTFSDIDLVRERFARIRKKTVDTINPPTTKQWLEEFKSLLNRNDLGSNGQMSDVERCKQQALQEMAKLHGLTPRAAGGFGARQPVKIGSPL